jgi:hypothetical protein
MSLKLQLLAGVMGPGGAANTGVKKAATAAATAAVEILSFIESTLGILLAGGKRHPA